MQSRQLSIKYSPIHFHTVKPTMNCASQTHPINDSGSPSITHICNCISHELLQHQVILR